ncbi:hypothetical protein DL765_006854 [Monosporascus sp. GIB2]|nr:hypothetical protein DL765_006854 [Monosporascus sp. GIB2]
MRRFSRSSNSHHTVPNSPPDSFVQPRTAVNGVPRGPMANSVGESQHELRPSSMGTENSFEFAPPRSAPAAPAANNHAVVPPLHPIPTMPVGSLSRTDQIVLRHFWEEKVQLNKCRDLHFLKVPAFSPHPSHNELVPFCEIYHLVRSTPGAAIIGLGSANGVYIGFELFSGSELKLNIHDEWANVSHYRVTFRSYDSLLKDPNSEAVFQSWPKPLTIEFLDDEYQKWSLDLTSLCWDGREVREFGIGGGVGIKQGDGSMVL